MPPPSAEAHKIPESVLVVIHTPDWRVLLIERAGSPGHWQSVTGSKDGPSELWWDTAVREVLEETGLNATAPGHVLTDWCVENVYAIYPQWRHRYAPDTVYNTERLFGLCVPDALPVTLAPREHTAQRWLPHREAADACFSPSNAEAILQLPHR